MFPTVNLRQWLAVRFTEPAFRRTAGFFTSVLAVLLIFHPIIAGWLRTSLTHDHYSHLVLIPFISGWLLYRNRNQWLSIARPALGAATVVALMGLAVLVAAWAARSSFSANDLLALALAGILVLALACYVGFFGLASARAAAFPLVFLFLAVPLPVFIIDSIIFGLQHASAEATYLLFKLTGVPVLRDGFVFVLPGVTIEVAKECSGIRSSTALFILALLSSHLLLRTNSRRIILVLLSLPLLIAKNAIRIVVLTLLAVHVDSSFLSGSLHREGGVLFFMFTAVIFGLLLRLLRRSERSLALVRPLATQAAHSSVN
jgi:exosortase